MSDTDDKYQAWLKVLGINPRAGAPGGSGIPSPFAEPAAPGQAAGWKPVVDDFNSPQNQAIRKGLGDEAAARQKTAEQELAAMRKSLADAKSYLDGLPIDDLRASTYAKVMADVRDRFPEAAGLTQWVKKTAADVPAMKGRLPAPGELLATVNAVLHDRGVEAGWNSSPTKSGAKLVTDQLLAAYMAQLPSGVGAALDGGVIRLSIKGAAVAVAAAGGEVDAAAGAGGATVKFKNADVAIEVANDGWKGFDPGLRAEWRQIGDTASTVLQLQADRDKARVNLEKKKAGGGTVEASLQADFDKLEAQFALASKGLQDRIKAAATASKDKVSASVSYLKQDGNGKESFKAGAAAEADLGTLDTTVSAYVANPTVEAALKVVAAADKVAATLELTAVKTGVVVTAKFEKALDETKAAIDARLDKSTKVAAELRKKADELTAKVKVVRDTKDLKLAAELEKTLKEVRAGVELELAKGPATVKGSAGVASGGKVDGKVQVDVVLAKGFSFTGDGSKLSFTGNVSTAGWGLGIAFSIGEPIDTDSLQSFITSADQQIRELYRLAGDKGVRSIADAEAINKKFKEAVEPIRAAADKAKALKGKTQISASLGIGITGDWPAGSKASAPTPTFNLVIRL